jgi:ATP-dependent Clp protease ATP-binding subunit ClpA
MASHSATDRTQEGVFSGLQWLGDRLGLARCQMPKNRIDALKRGFRDPVHGLIGQEHAADHIVKRYQHHLSHASGTLVLLFLGHAGAGKTFAANVIQRSLYLTPTDNGRQGFVYFVGGV